MSEDADPNPEVHEPSEEDVNALLSGAFDNSQMLPMAQGLKSFYDSCVVVGFSDERAMFLTVEFMRQIAARVG